MLFNNIDWKIKMNFLKIKRKEMSFLFIFLFFAPLESGFLTNIKSSLKTVFKSPKNIIVLLSTIMFFRNRYAILPDSLKNNLTQPSTWYQKNFTDENLFGFKEKSFVLSYAISICLFYTGAKAFLNLGKPSSLKEEGFGLLSLIKENKATSAAAGIITLLYLDPINFKGLKAKGQKTTGEAERTVQEASGTGGVERVASEHQLETRSKMSEALHAFLNYPMKKLKGAHNILWDRIILNTKKNRWEWMKHCYNKVIISLLFAYVVKQLFKKTQGISLSGIRPLTTDKIKALFTLENIKKAGIVGGQAFYFLSNDGIEINKYIASIKESLVDDDLDHSSLQVRPSLPPK